MANPNKTVAAFMAKQARPIDFDKEAARAERDPMRCDMAKFQAGKMTASEFQAKWG